MLGARKIVVLGGDVFRDEYSLAFDGTDDHVNLGNNQYFYPNDEDFAFTCWFKTTTTENDYFYSGGDGSDQGYIEFRIRGDDGGYIRSFLKDMDNSQELAFNTAVTGLNDGVWHHFAYTLDWSAKKGYAYIDGVYTSSATNTNIVTLANDADVIHIGKRSTTTSGTYEFTGNISDISIYNRFLSASEVSQIYNGGESYNHMDSSFKSNLQTWWRMGDGALDNFGDNGLIGDEVDPTMGGEILVNETFTGNASPWSLGSPWAYDSNKISIDGSQSGNVSLTQTPGYTTGVCYRVEFELSSYTAGEMNPHIRGGNSGNITGNGIHISYILAGSDSNTINLYCDSTFAATLDNASAKAIGGSPGIMVNMSADDITGDAP